MSRRAARRRCHDRERRGAESEPRRRAAGALRIGIGIHVGPAVVGRMGFAEAAYLTAVGDTVHVAARLEELTKVYGAELVISETVAVRAGLDVTGYPREELTLRNRSTPLAIRVIDEARRVAATLPPSTVSRS